jgi:acetyl esterase/lipase
MIRWLLSALAVALLGLSLLTVAKAPPWVPWQLAVLAGEFGHWFVLVVFFLATTAWWVREEFLGFTLFTLTICTAAAGLFAKPAVEAWLIGRALPARLSAQFGGTAPARSAFSSGTLWLGREPAPVPVRTLQVKPNLPLDFYPASGRRRAPCVVLVHGGGWDSGDRGQLPQLNHWLARQGYAVAAISYRLAPKFQWPAQREDVEAAIAFLKAKAGELDIDSTRLVLAGRSAGGQIAQTIGYTRGDPDIRGVVALYAPSDLVFGYVNTHENDMLKSPALMRQYLGGTPETAKAAYESASAYYHVAKGAPPTLLLHGTNDALVWYRHSVRLDARLAEVGVPHVFVSLPWATHAFEYNLRGPGGQLTTFALGWFLAAVTK